MSRFLWSLQAYQVIEPDEQLDLFACREVRLHLVARQLELGGHGDRTLCGGLLPARPRWQAMDVSRLNDRRLCEACQVALNAQRRGERVSW